MQSASRDEHTDSAGAARFGARNGWHGTPCSSGDAGGNDSDRHPNRGSGGNLCDGGGGNVPRLRRVVNDTD